MRDLEREIISLFRDVLLYCDELGLIEKQHFAIDGCKLPSNASKQWSGTLEELATKQKKMEKEFRHDEARQTCRQVAFFKRREAGSVGSAQSAIEAMKRKIDSTLGRWIYGRRIATVEPVFANVRNKGMQRFTLRGHG